MYALITSAEFFQGDIISEYNFVVQDLPSTDQEQRLISNLLSITRKAMVVTQTCDIQRRNFISLCPVYDFEEFKSSLLLTKSEEKVNSFLASIINQKTNYYLYIPAALFGETTVGASIVDLQLINSIPREKLQDYQRVVSLTDKGRHWLGFKLSSLYIRPF